MTNAKVATIELSLEDFEDCIKVSKLGHDMFIKWNADAGAREKGNTLEAEKF